MYFPTKLPFLSTTNAALLLFYPISLPWKQNSLQSTASSSTFSSPANSALLKLPSPVFLLPSVSVISSLRDERRWAAWSSSSSSRPSSPWPEFSLKIFGILVLLDMLRSKPREDMPEFDCVLPVAEISS
ncbi:hypothetical protein KSP40_PGU008033 [Platanthera guangdongensis]|uniref:Uncharacterized protein n=1 Tax=Platanthera guangdongensis TaxID=2320717 RepID=A0ABR2MEE6_9ASPA